MLKWRFKFASVIFWRRLAWNLVVFASGSLQNFPKLVNLYSDGGGERYTRTGIFQPNSLPRELLQTRSARQFTSDIKSCMRLDNRARHPQKGHWRETFGRLSTRNEDKGERADLHAEGGRFGSRWRRVEGGGRAGGNFHSEWNTVISVRIKLSINSVSGYFRRPKPDV